MFRLFVVGLVSVMLFGCGGKSTEESILDVCKSHHGTYSIEYNRSMPFDSLISKCVMKDLT
jgi:hypothetical protein